MLNLEKSIVWTTTNSRSFLPNCIIIPMEQNYEKIYPIQFSKKWHKNSSAIRKNFFEFLIEKLSKQNLNFSYFMYLVSHVGIMMAYVFVVS